jgi:hypothetical protein
MDIDAAMSRTVPSVSPGTGAICTPQTLVTGA